MSNRWINRLSMWSNDFDFVIAATLKEAKTYAGQIMFGRKEPQALQRYEEFERDELDSAEWYELDLDGEFRYGHDDGKIETKTVREFIDIYGAGYFACSEY